MNAQVRLESHTKPFSPKRSVIQIKNEYLSQIRPDILKEMWDWYLCLHFSRMYKTVRP